MGRVSLRQSRFVLWTAKPISHLVEQPQDQANRQQPTCHVCTLYDSRRRDWFSS
jgi:hypothetical protein